MENVSLVRPAGKFPEKSGKSKKDGPFSRLELSERNFVFHYFTRFSYFIPVSIVTNSAAILVSHRVTGSAPIRSLRSNGTTFYLSENPFLFPLKFPDFSPEWKALTLHFPYMKDKVSQTFWPGLHYCIHRTYNGTKQWSLSQHQSVIYKGKVYTVLLPFNKTINNWTILVDTDLTLFFYFLVSGSSPFVQRE